MSRKRIPCDDPLPWPFVEVRWRDSVSDSKWRNLKDLPKTVEIRSRGWLLVDGDEEITVAATLGAVSDGDPAVGEVTAIGRGSISSIRTLKV
jgi:hypothetical protein